MENISLYIENINSTDSSVRKKSLFDLMYIVGMRNYNANDESKISNAIKNIYSILDKEEKTAAFDILSRFQPEEDSYELAKIELSSTYKNFKITHAYLLKLLESIEQVEHGNIERLGDQFSIDKQFAIAYQWLKKNNPTSLD